jgi:hypothetical protein
MPWMVEIWPHCIPVGCCRDLVVPHNRPLDIRSGPPPAAVTIFGLAPCGFDSSRQQHPTVRMRTSVKMSTTPGPDGNRAYERFAVTGHCYENLSASVKEQTIDLVPEGVRFAVI